MNSLEINNIVEANRTGISEIVKRSFVDLERIKKTYPNVIMDIVSSGRLSEQLDLSESESAGNGRIDINSPLSSTAGAYFFNEEIIGGSREKQAVIDVNKSGKTVIGNNWTDQETKFKLGPGIGMIEAPQIYRDLMIQGIANPDLTLNYTAPLGTLDARRGIKDIMDAKIDPEGNFFPDSGVFVTEGATEGIDLFMEAVSKISPGSRVVFMGLSYYTGLYSAFQKGLKVDRLATNPIKVGVETRFFPSADEIERSLPKDTSAIVISSPNNPNGEIYSDQDLTKIVTLAQQKKIFILYDAIFENMYFDDSKNYRSRILQIASEIGALDRIVVVDSLSKTKNFAGERIGYMAMTDEKMIKSTEDTVLARRCNPRLTLGPILRFEGLARKAKALLIRSPKLSLETVVDFVTQRENLPFGKMDFAKKFVAWDNWNTETLKYYSDNLKIVKALLEKTAIAYSPDQGAFNTFIKVVDPGKDINSIDFLAKFMYTMATYTQVGPCFGISQKCWDSDLGIWPRITYASSREDLIEAINRLIVFTRFYQEKYFGDPNKFPTLQIRFDQQI